ncbi:uncharacterized protein LOC117639691 [Thrips palmi]|uniref:Uncharacterized protein LOC117639691 n=1 Tax=Thrips palmi TaxID=161013 RepID=A0A6P8Y638_THRPL|nr:uncharacterized protein LOC117639691 [Thrips palmi]
MQKVLILVALLGVAAAFKTANSGCGFECKDGDCVDLNKRCNGRDDCSNGRDEESALCDALPTVALPVNTTVTARVQHGAHSGVLLLLCGKSCTKVWLVGTGEEGELRHWTWMCDAHGGKCSKVQSASVTTGFGHGEIELVVQHRANELAVWRKDHPADVVTAAVDPTKSASRPSTLRIRPHTWEQDMPVQFSDATVA